MIQVAPFGAMPERLSLKSELKSSDLFVQQACVECLLPSSEAWSCDPESVVA